jgi:hypothetical protein
MFEQSYAIKFCVMLGESATVTYEKLQRAYGEHSLSRCTRYIPRNSLQVKGF